MKSSRTCPLGIVMITTCLILLSGCDEEQTTPVHHPTDEPILLSSTPSSAPIPSQTPSPTPLPSPTAMDGEALLSYLQTRAVLNPNNIDQLELLGEIFLESEEIPFRYHSWSEDGDWLAVCYPGPPDVIEIYHLEKFQSITTIEPVENDYLDNHDCGMYQSETTPDSRAQSFVFSREGDLLAVPYGGGQAIYQTATGKLVSELDTSPQLEQIAFSSQGTRIAAGYYYSRVGVSMDTEVHLFDTQTGAYWGYFRKVAPLTDLAYSTLGDYLLTAGTSGVIAWHVEGGQLPLVPCPNAEITFSPIDETAALTCRPIDHENWRQLIWNIPENEVITLNSAPDDQIIELFYSSDGEMLVGYTNSGQLSVWETKQGTLLVEFEYGPGSMVDVRFILDSKALAILESNGKISIYGLSGDD